MCNASTTAVKYTEVTSEMLTEAARRKAFAKDSADEAYVVQGSTDRSNYQGRSSSRQPTNQRASPRITESATIARNRCQDITQVRVETRRDRGGLEPKSKRGRRRRGNRLRRTKDYTGARPFDTDYASVRRHRKTQQTKYMYVYVSK